MKTCPDCNAPNPPRLTACFACGQSLEPPVAAPPPQPTPTGPVTICEKCATVIPPGGSFCPACGAKSAPMTPPPAAAATRRPVILPNATIYPGPSPPAVLAAPGWKAQPLPNGVVRLQRTTRRRVVEESAGPILCLPVGLLLIRIALRGDQFAAPPIVALFYVLGALILLLGAGFAAWLFWSEESVHAGQGFLERTQSLGPIIRRWRFDLAAEIRIDFSTGKDFSGTFERRKLRIVQPDQQLALDERTKYDMPFGTDNAKPVTADDLSIFGEYLAQLTGWPFTDPTLGRY